MGAEGAAGGRLLAGALAWAGGRGPDLAPEAGAVRGWPRLLRMASHRGFLETLAHALVASGAEGALPEEVAGALRAVLEAATARNLVLLSEAARLQRRLAERGIPSVALKGAAMLAAHYPAPGARHASDLDLLVPAARVAEAQAALADEGPDRPPVVDLAGRPSAVAGAHLWPFDTAAGATCELHHRLPGWTGPEAAARVLATARQVAIPGGRTLRIPLPADCAAIAILHALAHHGAAPLRFLPRLAADLCALEATAGLDWAAVRQSAGPEGAAAVERAGALLSEVRQGRVDAVFPGGAARLREGVHTLLAALRMGPRVVFPARRFMAWRYGVPERSPRLLLYYLARPVLAVRDRLRG